MDLKIALSGDLPALSLIHIFMPACLLHSKSDVKFIKLFL